MRAICTSNSCSPWTLFLRLIKFWLIFGTVVNEERGGLSRAPCERALRPGSLGRWSWYIYQGREGMIHQKGTMDPGQQPAIRIPCHENGARYLEHWHQEDILQAGCLDVGMWMRAEPARCRRNKVLASAYRDDELVSRLGGVRFTPNEYKKPLVPTHLFFSRSTISLPHHQLHTLASNNRFTTSPTSTP